jgi:ubiquinone/menaquinone biosynthesis C-methylase UbiE
MAAHYDDPTFSYKKYWQGREYEHLSEVIAINRLLKNAHFNTSVDIGGGFGRLTYLLSKISQKTYLIEPSIKQLKLASKVLSTYTNTTVQKGTSDNTGLKSSSIDLAIIIRVFHHLPTLQSTFSELRRIIVPQGLAVIEFANSTNLKSQIQNIVSGKSIPLEPLEKRSEVNIKKHTIPFVNHHPHEIYQLLRSNNFEVVSTLSVSNFRSPFLKQFIPLQLLLILEWIVQPILSYINFGPSIFLLVRRLS